MKTISDTDFEKIISRALDELPEKYTRHLNNIAITYADEPDDSQRHKLHLGAYQTLFGLYEGILLTKRGMGYNLVLPDKITIFKLPLVAASSDEHELFERVKHTLWHEIAHFYGLDHDRIDALDKKRSKS